MKNGYFLYKEMMSDETLEMKLLCKGVTVLSEGRSMNLL